MKRRLLVGVAVMVGVAMAMFGLTPTASSVVDPDDLGIIFENAPGAGAELAGAAQDTADTFVETQGAVETFETAVLGGMNALAALVNGTEQFGDLPLAFAILAAAIVTPSVPLLEAVDDPACVLGLLDDPTVVCEGGQSGRPVLAVDDAGVVLGNAPDVPKALMEGVGAGPNGNGMRSAVIELLQGNLVEDDFLAGCGQPAFAGDAMGGALSGFWTLIEGSSYADPGWQFALALGACVSLTLAAGQLHEAEETLEPAFEAAEPATSPLVELLSGISL